MIEEGNRSPVLDRLLDPNAAPGYSVPDIEVMTEETLTLVSAGYDSTAIAMMLSFVYICRDPEVYGKLVAEIDGHMHDGGRIVITQGDENMAVSCMLFP